MDAVLSAVDEPLQPVAEVGEPGPVQVAFEDAILDAQTVVLQHRHYLAAAAIRDDVIGDDKVHAFGYIMMRMAAFLGRIEYREAWLALEAQEEGELPPYLGSTLRGALGHLLRRALCDGPGCGDSCLRPESCRYYALFEQARPADGGSAPKPMILEPPLNQELEEIALGAPVRLPYCSGPPLARETVPTLRNEHVLRAEQGAILHAGLRLVGPLSAALAGILSAVDRHGLQLGGIRFRLRAARDAAGRMLFDRQFPEIPPQQPALLRLSAEPERARRVRIVFQTPAMLKLGRKVSFDPAEFAARFFEHSLARAVQVHNCLTGGPRLPWMELPRLETELVGYRLFHYHLPRFTFRQQKRLDFDGMIGFLDLKGDFDPVMPYARAAEVLHWGQKATFGLGKVRVLILE